MNLVSAARRLRIRSQRRANSKNALAVSQIVLGTEEATAD